MLSSRVVIFMYSNVTSNVHTMDFMCILLCMAVGEFRNHHACKLLYAIATQFILNAIEIHCITKCEKYSSFLKFFLSSFHGHINFMNLFN